MIDNEINVQAYESVGAAFAALYQQVCEKQHELKLAWYYKFEECKKG